MKLLNRMDEFEKEHYKLRLQLSEANKTVLALLKGQITDSVKASEVAFKNIKDRKRSDDLFKDSVEKRRLIMQAALDAIICIDTNGKIIFWNPQAEKIFGWSEKEVTGRVLCEIIIPQQFRAMYDTSIEHYLKTRQGKALNVLLELSAINRSNKEFPIELTVLPINQGGEEFFCAFLRDITERKRSEQLLRNNYEQLKLTFNSSSDVLFDADLVTNQVLISDVYEKEYGYKCTNIMTPATNWLCHIHPDDRAAVEADLHSAIASTDTRWTYIYRFNKSDGTIAEVKSRANILRNDQGKAYRLIGSMQDITDIREAERKNNKITNDLIQRNKDLEQFTYIISHNLRAPIANLLGLATELIDINSPEDLRKEFTKHLYVSALKLDEVIRDLNNILCLKQEVHDVTETFKLSSVVENIKIGIQTLIEKYEVKIEADFTEADTISSIKSFLHSIFYNLISNSIKYRSPGLKPVISIKSFETALGIHLVISDNGIGFDMKKNNGKVFGLYTRFHSDIEGRGIGLFMTKSQIEALGGTIEVQSEVYRGTTFKIYLPLRNS